MSPAVAIIQTQAVNTKGPVSAGSPNVPKNLCNAGITTTEQVTVANIAMKNVQDFKTLQRYVNQYGQIETRKKTGLTESQQRRLSVAIKRARHIALLPFVANN